MCLDLILPIERTGGYAFVDVETRSCCFVREEKRSASDAVINAVVVHREGLRLISNISMSSSVNRKLNTSGFHVLMYNSTIVQVVLFL